MINLKSTRTRGGDSPSLNDDSAHHTFYDPIDADISNFVAMYQNSEIKFILFKLLINYSKV